MGVTPHRDLRGLACLVPGGFSPIYCSHRHAAPGPQLTSLPRSRRVFFGPAHRCRSVLPRRSPDPYGEPRSSVSTAAGRSSPRGTEPFPWGAALAAPLKSRPLEPRRPRPRRAARVRPFPVALPRQRTLSRPADFHTPPQPSGAFLVTDGGFWLVPRKGFPDENRMVCPEISLQTSCSRDGVGLRIPWVAARPPSWLSESRDLIAFDHRQRNPGKWSQLPHDVALLIFQILLDQSNQDIRSSLGSVRLVCKLWSDKLAAAVLELRPGPGPIPMNWASKFMVCLRLQPSPLVPSDCITIFAIRCLRSANVSRVLRLPGTFVLLLPGPLILVCCCLTPPWAASCLPSQTWHRCVCIHSSIAERQSHRLDWSKQVFPWRSFESCGSLSLQTSPRSHSLCSTGSQAAESSSTARVPGPRHPQQPGTPAGRAQEAPAAPRRLKARQPQEHCCTLLSLLPHRPGSQRLQPQR